MVEVVIARPAVISKQDLLSCPKILNLENWRLRQEEILKVRDFPAHSAVMTFDSRDYLERF